MTSLVYWELYNPAHKSSKLLSLASSLYTFRKYQECKLFAHQLAEHQMLLLAPPLYYVLNTNFGKQNYILHFCLISTRLRPQQFIPKVQLTSNLI